MSFHDFRYSSKKMLLAASCLAIFMLGYVLDIRYVLFHLSDQKQKGKEFRVQLRKMEQEMLSGSEFSQQLEKIKPLLAMMSKRLIQKSEVPALLAAVSKEGVASGLTFKLFKPDMEKSSDSYRALPIQMTVVGSYQHLAHFMASLSAFDRLIIPENFTIVEEPLILSKEIEENDQTHDNLIMDIVLKTYFRNDNTVGIVSSTPQMLGSLPNTTHWRNPFQPNLKYHVVPSTAVPELFPGFSVNKDKQVSFDFQEISVRTALQLLAKAIGLNLVMSDAVRGNLSLHLQKVPWEQALDVMLKTRGLGRRHIGSTLLIAPLEEITSHEKQEILANQQSIETESLKPEKQVLIEAYMVVVNKAFEEDIGVKLGLNGLNHLSGSLDGSSLLTQGTTLSDIPIAQRLNFDLSAAPSIEGVNNTGKMGLALMKLSANLFLDLELSALESEGGGKVISNPRLITTNQKEALIQTGEEIPYQEKTTSGSTSIAFKKAVLSLRVTPHVTADNKILLTLQVNQDKRSASPDVLGVPAIDTRSIETHVWINNGQTLVLGGVYEKSDHRMMKRVPFLWRLPLVGGLLSNKQSIDNVSELLIFVTPKIIAPPH